MSKSKSAYFIFCDEHRDSAKAELSTQQTKVAVSDVAKALGEKWKNLSEDEKQKYRDMAEALKTSAVAPAAEGVPAVEGDGNGHGSHAKTTPTPTGLPLSNIKKIISLDPEVGRVSHEALVVISAATEAFLQQMAHKSMSAAQRSKRRTIKLDDFQHIVKMDRRMTLAGLRDVVKMVEALQSQQAAAKAAAATTGADTEEQSGKENIPKAPTAATKKQKTVAHCAKIDAFFKQKTTAT